MDATSAAMYPWDIQKSKIPPGTGILYRLAKRLFPTLPRELRRRKLNALFLVLFVSLLVIGGIVLLILLANG